MASYYNHTHHHHNHNQETNTQIQDQNSNNYHTLILMNPNLTNPHQQFVHIPTSPGPQPNNITLYGYPSHEASDIPRARQGLSLTLSSQNPALGGTHHGLVLGSKYLKATQELLDEVVHVGNDNNSDGLPKKEISDDQKEKMSFGDGGSVQLSTADRQEIQMKKAKLVTMLDEAEQRYRKYNHQMQIVIESFEQAAGLGSAKTYTSLALKTISKQFRCLKDAIQAQIRAANKSLGDHQESSGGKIEGSRLKYIDHQIRQQRALQQLGMIQNPTAWRPQRGLPERSVSVLRAWLFEHFLHPYPKDSDKIMLAKQTGLTRSQVSNWFINARVRLWKPMIEEMYTEELKEQEQNDGISEEKLQERNKENCNNEANPAILDQIYNQDKTHEPKTYKDPNNVTIEGGIPQRSPKRQRNDEVIGYNNGTNNGEMMIKFRNEKQERETETGYALISGGMNFLGGSDELGTYPIGELGRFDTEDFSPPPRYLHGNGISLSLGLPPCDNLSITNHTILSQNPNLQFRRANEFGAMQSPPSGHSNAAAFECVDVQNRKGFAAQLLPDFVA